MTEREKLLLRKRKLELELELEAEAKPDTAPTPESQFGSEGFSQTEDTLRQMDPTRKVRAALGTATFGWAPELMGWLDAPKNATPEQAYESSQKWRKEYGDAAEENPVSSAAGLLAQPDPFGKVKAAKGALGPALQAGMATMARPGDVGAGEVGLGALAGGLMGRAGDAVGSTFAGWLGKKSAANAAKALAETEAANAKVIASAKGELGAAAQAGSRGIENLTRYAGAGDLLGDEAAMAAQRRLAEPATQEAAARFATSAADDFPGKLPAMESKQKALADLMASRESDIAKAQAAKMKNPIFREAKPRLYRDFSRFGPMAVGSYLGSKVAEGLDQDRLAGAGIGGFLGGALGGRPGTAYANLVRKPEVRWEALGHASKAAESVGNAISSAAGKLGAPIGGALSQYFGMNDQPVQSSSPEQAREDLLMRTGKRRGQP